MAEKSDNGLPCIKGDLTHEDSKRGRVCRLMHRLAPSHGKKMKSFLWRATMLTVLLVCMSFAFAQNSGVDQKALRHEVMGHYLAGDHELAIAAVKNALNTAEKNVGPDDPEVATLLNYLADLYIIRARHAEAESALKRALRIREKALGPNHADVGTNLSNLALLYTSVERYAEAEVLYKRALVILEKALGEDHRSLAMIWENLGSLYSMMERHEEAQEMFDKAARIAKP